MLHTEQRAVLTALGHTVEKQERVWAVQTHLQKVLDERLWAGILAHYVCLSTGFVITWSRKHGIHLKPVALLVEMHTDPFYSYRERVGPSMLDLFYETVIDDLFDDTATCTTLMDAEALHTWLQAPTTKHHAEEGKTA